MKLKLTSRCADISKNIEYLLFYRQKDQNYLRQGLNDQSLVIAIILILGAITTDTHTFTHTHTHIYTNASQGLIKEWEERILDKSPTFKIYKSVFISLYRVKPIGLTTVNNRDTHKHLSEIHFIFLHHTSIRHNYISMCINIYIYIYIYDDPLSLIRSIHYH